MLLDYVFYNLHTEEPRTITTYTHCEVLEDKDRTVHFYSGNPLSPTSSMYVPMNLLVIEPQSEAVDRLMTGKGYQLLAKKKNNDQRLV